MCCTQSYHNLFSTQVFFSFLFYFIIIIIFWLWINTTSIAPPKHYQYFYEIYSVKERNNKIDCDLHITLLLYVNTPRLDIEITPQKEKKKPTIIVM